MNRRLSSGSKPARSQRGLDISPVTLKERVRYRVDQVFSRGTGVMIAVLLLGSLLLVALITAVITVTRIHPPLDDGSSPTVFQAFWATFMHTFDPSLIAYDTTASRSYLAAMLVITLGGVFTVGSLFGIMTNGVAQKLGELRKGRSRVVEDDHVVVLGWSSVAPEIVAELVEARRQREGRAIVVLAPKDKIEMEDDLRERIADPGRTRLVCRRGDPVVSSDMALARPETARCIVVLSPPVADPDIQVMKTVLALCGDMRRRGLDYDIVAQLIDPRSLPAARLAGNDQVHYVVTRDVTARIAVQACRQSGLCIVYHDLFDFRGDEIQIWREPHVRGRTFADVVLMYPEASIFGILRANGAAELVPDGAAKVEEGDAIIAVAGDPHTQRLGGSSPARVDEEAITPPERRSMVHTERILVLGWNERGSMVVDHLAEYAAPGSEVVVVTDDPAAASLLERPSARSRGVRIRLHRGEPSDRAVLEEVDVASHDHVLTLSPSDRYSPQEADARTLITLLHLRDIGAKGHGQFTIVSEMLDGKNRDVADHATADDFIVSEEIVSDIVAQEAHSPAVRPVIAQLIGPRGPSIHLKLASDYVALGQPVDFYTVVAAAVRRGEAAIGYRKPRAEAVRLNPRKDDKVTFEPADTIIVVAHGL